MELRSELQQSCHELNSGHLLDLTFPEEPETPNNGHPICSDQVKTRQKRPDPLIPASLYDLQRVQRTMQEALPRRNGPRHNLLDFSQWEDVQGDTKEISSHRTDPSMVDARPEWARTRELTSRYTSSRASEVRSSEYADILCRESVRSLLARTSITFAEISPGSAGQTWQFLSPASKSGTSPTRVLTTGRLQAKASLTTLGEPSFAEVSKSKSAAL